MNADTLELQAMCDAVPNGIVDLKGRTFWIHSLRLGPPYHRNLELINGNLITYSDKNLASKRYGVVELCKNQTWRGRTYSDESFSVKFTNIGFYGGQTKWSDDFLLNYETLGKEQGFSVHGINAINGSRVDNAIIVGCTFDTLHEGAMLMSTINSKIRDCKFRRISGTCAGYLTTIKDLPVARHHDIYRCNYDDVGSVFNFSAPDLESNEDATVIPSFMARYLNATKVRGRTKVHGRWNGAIYRCKLDMDRISRSQYANLSFPSGKNISVDDCDLSGSIVGGISVPADSHPNRPNVYVTDSRINGGQLAFNCSCPLYIAGVTLNGCYLPWGDSVPPKSVTGLVNNNPLSVEAMAREFYIARKRVAEWNMLNGSTYANNYWWIANPVRTALAAMEAAA